MDTTEIMELELVQDIAPSAQQLLPGILVTLAQLAKGHLHHNALAMWLNFWV